MQQRALSIIRSINNMAAGCNILTAPTHERYQGNLGGLPYTFYMCNGPEYKPWNDKYGKMPKNHHWLSNDITKGFPAWLEIDIILSQNKFSQIQTFKPFADQINCPIISLEHTWPSDEMTDKQKTRLATICGDVNVFISDQSAKAWGWDPNDENVEIIYHGVDTDVFCLPDKEYETNGIGSCVNDWINRDYWCGYKLWQEVTDGLQTKVIGDTPGLSKPAESVQELVDFYNTSTVFLNTSLRSPIPTVVLEAMACGKCVVSTNNCAIPDVIEHGVNGLVSNDAKELREHLEFCLKHPTEIKQMGLNARKTIEEKFSLNKHLERWQNLIEKIYGTMHNGNN